MFWERQEGGLCRKHSLNAYYQNAKISTQEFQEWGNKYNNYLEEKYGNKIVIQENDIVYSNDIGIIPYIIKHLDYKYCFHFALNQIPETFQHYNIPNVNEWLNDNDFIFVYNHGHIWGMKKENNNWHKIDSLSGISASQNVHSLHGEKNQGIIIPREKGKQMEDRVTVVSGIKRYLSQHSGNQSIEGIEEIINKTISMGKNADWLEPLVGLYINILETIEQQTQEEILLLEDYDKFLRHYERNKTDYEYLKTNFSKIVYKINNLQ